MPLLRCGNSEGSVTASFIMAYLKQLHEDLKKHFINEGVAGSNPGKGSKHWVCKYCETRFDGTASVIKTHFLNRCSLDHVRRPLSMEERARREEGIRMGKFIAETIHAGGRSRPATNSLASVSSLVADVERGRTDSPVGAGEAVVADEPAAIAPTSGESVQPAPRSRRPLSQTVMRDADSIVTRNEQTSRFLDRFLFCRNQPFSIVDNEYFLDFVDAVKKAHPSWMPYKRDEAQTKRLDGHYERTKVDVHAMMKKWQRTGCMLQMDGWSDRRSRPYINVMVSSPIETVFWKTTCMEGKDKDAEAYFRILDGVIKEIGEEEVVGVVMDNARVCVKAGKMVGAAYPHIFRVGCTAHALDLALEDMYKELEWLRKVVDAGLKVGKFFHNVDKARALFHVYSPKSKLKRSGVTRFATNHEMLASLKKAKNPLKNCVDDAVWVEKMMDSLVAQMRKLDCITTGEKAEIEDILMRRWAFMTSELHCAVAFLDPEHRHTNALRDPAVHTGFNIWLLSWALDDQQTRNELNHQVDMWINLDGSFKSQEAAEATRVQPAALWWEAYCRKLDLQPQAVKLLGQASSSAACKRNWSLHELIFSRRRTKLLPERLGKLVYSNWNTQLSRAALRGEGGDVHIPWEDDTPVEAEIKEWYNTWIAEATDPAAVAADADVLAEDVEVGEEDGSEPLMRTWQRNDVADDEECDEDMALLGSLEREWHECTKPDRRRKQDLQRRSGSSLPPPLPFSFFFFYSSFVLLYQRAFTPSP
ncbi:hypothetical protein CBR_g10765 [Chara braunii]|uniref:DUF659 domain-containing protein n=1 Tax=Chara braunii TaxID=69332 RepID=A0A388KPF5_CHABU|nr:hypothetical protein CBR_g10765 [Chara braunii]|eukprot:GBG71823.1 hypothetical protein CBR_g10765 [Chara braunii]